MGGAFMAHHPEPGSTDPPEFRGSILLARAPSREVVMEQLRQDIYHHEKVWDLDNVSLNEKKKKEREGKLVSAKSSRFEEMERRSRRGTVGVCSVGINGTNFATWVFETDESSLPSAGHDLSIQVRRPNSVIDELQTSGAQMTLPCQWYCYFPFLLFFFLRRGV